MKADDITLGALVDLIERAKRRGVAVRVDVFPSEKSDSNDDSKPTAGFAVGEQAASKEGE